MKLATGETLLTVKDIADWISIDRSEEGIARAMRQVRHWTQSDVLRTASEKNTGKGVPRFYDKSPSVWIATILFELCRYGATVDMLKPVADELYDHWEKDGGMYFLTPMIGDDSYLQVAWNTDPKTGRFTDASIHMFDDFDRGSGDYQLMSEPTSSIVINMAQLENLTTLD
jgi:hypothetical protein